MDSWRTDWSDFTGAEFGVPELDLAHEAFLPEPPPEAIGQDERRMQLRAHAHWSSLRRNHAFPPIRDLRLDEVSEFADHAVLLDFSLGIENPGIAFLGDRLAEECANPTLIRRLSDIPGSSLLALIADHYVQILAFQAPVGFEAEFVNRHGRTMLYRGMLLPFADGDGAISHVLGVLNWKELADPQLADALLRELEPHFAPGGAEPVPVNPDAPRPRRRRQSATTVPTLMDCLLTARAMARAARTVHDGGRYVLYAAIGAAWDFALAAEACPAQYARLLAEAGMKQRVSAPMLSLVKLVFGPGHDKTRLTEYATVLAHAQRLGIARGALAGWLSATGGGLKGAILEERRLRSGALAATTRHTAREQLAERLRRLPPRPLGSLDTGGAEFPVLLARRLPSGEVTLLAEVAGDDALLERMARHLPN
jgi:hypothetical protein